MSKVTDALTAKVGPLPAWAWGLALGGTIVGVRAYMAKRSAPAGNVSSDGATAPAGSGTDASIPPEQTPTPGTVGSYPVPTGYQANPGGVIGYNGDVPQGGTPTGPDTNLDWSNEAFDILRAQGYAPVAASEALRKYLNGEPLTAADEGMVSIALRQLGQPPEGAPAVTRAPDAVTQAPVVAPVAPTSPQQAIRTAAPAIDTRSNAQKMLDGDIPATPAEKQYAAVIVKLMAEHPDWTEAQAVTNFNNLLAKSSKP